MMQNDDFCIMGGFFPDKEYINLSSQGVSIVIQKYYWFSTNTKLNAKS